MIGERLLDVMPHRLVDLDDWAAIAEEDAKRLELLEGVLQVSPPLSARHQRLMGRLVAALDETSPDDRIAVHRLDVLIESGPAPTVRAPDVVVIRSDTPEDRNPLLPADVVAAVEIHCPGSYRTDRVAKRAEYAEVGIAHYLLVEPGPPVVLTELVLDGGAYRVRAEHRGTATLALGATVDLDAL